MRNIFLLPTSELTRIHYDNDFFISPRAQISRSINSIVSGYHIYITTDDKFVRDEWITDGIECIKASSKLVDAQGLVNRRKWKKIILTTDLTLINDGIADLFLMNENFIEWFIKHTDTEWVKVTPLMSNNMRALFGYKVEYCTCKPGEPYNNTCCKIHGNIESFSLGNSKCSCMRYSPGDFTSLCRNCGLPPKTTPTPITFTWEEVKNIATWSFNFYKRNDLNDDELETEWETLLNKMYEKKLL